MATVRDSALVTNRLRLTPSRSARSTRAWCKDFGKRTVNLPLYLVKSPDLLPAARAGALLAPLRADLLAGRDLFLTIRLIPLVGTNSPGVLQYSNPGARESHINR